MLNVKKTLTKILGFLKTESGSVSTSSSLGFTVQKRAGIVTITCASGTVTAALGSVIGTIEDGFRPAFTVGTYTEAGGYRIQIDTLGRISCTSTLSNASLRFTLTFIGGGYSLKVFSVLSRLVRGWEYVRSETAPYKVAGTREFFNGNKERIGNSKCRLFCSSLSTASNEESNRYIGGYCWRNRFGKYGNMAVRDAVKRFDCIIDKFCGGGENGNSLRPVHSGRLVATSKRGWSCA